MTSVCVEITRWLEDYEPGAVECRLVDARGREWLFIEKVPVVTKDVSVSASSIYPIKGLIACRVIAYVEDLNRRRTVRITTENPWHVATADGQKVFEVRPEQIVTESRLAND